MEKKMFLLCEGNIVVLNFASLSGTFFTIDEQI